VHATVGGNPGMARRRLILQFLFHPATKFAMEGHVDHAQGVKGGEQYPSE